MSLADLPVAVTAFVEAARAGNIRDLVADFTADAAIFDRDREHRGPAIIHWGNWFFAQPRKLIHPIKASGKDSVAIVSVIVSDIERTKSEQLEWSFTMAGQKISALSVQASKLPNLPPAVAAYVLATNVSDLEGLVNAFVDDAVVNDQLCEFRGRDAIRQWAMRDIIGQHVTMYVVKAIRQYGDVVVVAHVDGDYDKKGLPHPLVLTFYFSITEEKIVQLIILRNESIP